jgi:catechol 2,3-dioxygenase-like lactoylglutathione lyase family enzyme
MITGIHTLFYSRKPDEARAFLRDVLGLRFVDSGGGWLIFAAPPAELAIHPIGDDEGDAPADGIELHLMCTDISDTVAQLRAKGMEITKGITDEGYGLFTALRIPGGAEIGIYEPRHPTALSLAGSSAAKKAGARGAANAAEKTGANKARSKKQAAKKRR